MAHTDKRLPNSRWYQIMDELYSKKFTDSVIQDINSNPEVFVKTKAFKSSFVKYASLSRMHYLPDINEELKEYLSRCRMFNSDVKKWYRLRNEIFTRDNYTCQYCGKKEGKLELDHVVAFSKGGGDDTDNLVTACRKCNRQKRDKSIEEFKLWRLMNG